jgi:hypothetical protein
MGVRTLVAEGFGWAKAEMSFVQPLSALLQSEIADCESALPDLKLFIPQNNRVLVRCREPCLLLCNSRVPMQQRLVFVLKLY